jgi:hypothetical protein
MEDRLAEIDKLERRYRILKGQMAETRMLAQLFQNRIRDEKTNTGTVSQETIMEANLKASKFEQDVDKYDKRMTWIERRLKELNAAD